MKPNKIGAFIVAVFVAIWLLAGCSNGSNDQTSSSGVVAAEQAQEPKPPVFKPENEGNEDEDVSALRLVEKPSMSDSSSPDMYAACNFTNNTDEVSDYYAEAIVTSPKGYDSKVVWFDVEDVSPGKTVQSDYRIGPNYDLTDWQIHFTLIDRTSNEEGQSSDKMAEYSLKLMEKQVSGVPQVSLDWSVTNNADGSVYPEPSGYLVKYQIIGTDDSGVAEVIATSKLETNALLPGTDVQPGETQTGSISMEKVVQGRNFTVSETGDVQGLMVNVTDVDRISYVQQ